MATTIFGRSDPETPELATFEPPESERGWQFPLPASDGPAGSAEPQAPQQGGQDTGLQTADEAPPAPVPVEPTAEAVQDQPAIEPSQLSLTEMELLIEDGLLMVFGPEGDPVPPAAFIELAAEQPGAMLSFADGTGASAVRVAAVLEAQTLGRLGAAEQGDRWIQTMLREGEGPEQASEATIETELTNSWPEPFGVDAITACDEQPHALGPNEQGTVEPDVAGHLNPTGHFEAAAEPGHDTVVETAPASNPKAMADENPGDSVPDEAWPEWQSADSDMDGSIEPDGLSSSVPDLDRDVLGATPNVASDLDPAETLQAATSYPAAAGIAAESFSPDAPDPWGDLETRDRGEQAPSGESESLLDELANGTGNQEDFGAVTDPVEAFAAIADVVADTGAGHGDTEIAVSSEAYQADVPDEERCERVATPVSPTNEDVDPESLVLVVVRGVPDGAQLSSGVCDDDGSWSLNPSELASVTISLGGEGQERLLGIDGTLSITGIALDEGGALKAVSEVVPLEDYLAEPGPEVGALSLPRPVKSVLLETTPNRSRRRRSIPLSG